MKEVIVSYKKIFDSNNQYDGALVNEYVKKLKQLNNHVPPLESFVLVTNTSKQSYDYVDDNFESCLGHSRDRMLAEGLKYYLSFYHPEELPILLRIFEELMVFTMTELDIDQRRRVVYGWNYRIKNSKGVYKNMQIQQTPIFFDDNGRPVIGYSQNTIVGEGIPKPLVATCKYLNADNEFETLFYKNYFLEALERALTKREVDVVKYIAKSHTTKEIADILNISEHTVSVHRKNILNKLEFNSTAEIIEYCNRYQTF